MERMKSLVFVCTIGLALSAPVTAGVIVDQYNGNSFASAFVAHQEGGLGPFLQDDVLVTDDQASTSQTFSAASSARAQASLMNIAGQEISSLVSAGHSFAVQRNGEQVSILGAATTSIQGTRLGTFFDPNNSLITSTGGSLRFSLTTAYEVAVDFTWVAAGGSPLQTDGRFFSLVNRSLASLIINEESGPGTYGYQGLLPSGDYQLSYSAHSSNDRVATLPPVTSSTAGRFSFQLSPAAQSVPEPTSFALFALGMLGLVRRRMLGRRGGF